MKVTLLAYSPLELAVIAARTCYDSADRGDNLGDKDEQLLLNIVASGHTSVLEHLNYTFKIEGISRGCLQQLVRHRHASYSVESTRYTMKKKFKNNLMMDLFVSSGDKHVDNMIEGQLAYIRNIILGESCNDFRNDDLKYALPEAFKTDLLMTVNARSLMNFFEVRLANDAHNEIRSLADEMLSKLPNRHNFLYEEFKYVIKG